MIDMVKKVLNVEDMWPAQGHSDIFRTFFGGASHHYPSNSTSGFTQHTSSETMGFKVGGAKDVNTFREKIENNYAQGF